MRRAPSCASCWWQPSSKGNRAGPRAPSFAAVLPRLGGGAPCPGSWRSPVSRRGPARGAGEQRAERGGPRASTSRAPTARRAVAPPGARVPARPETSPTRPAPPRAARMGAWHGLRSGRVPSEPRSSFSPLPPGPGP